MSDAKRKFEGGDSKRKKKYRSDGTPIWGKRHVEGPGVWVSCVKGKEKQTVGEIYELFESIASEIWPIETPIDKNSDEEEDDTGLSLEERVAKEVSDMKRPRSGNPQQRFANCQTNTPCGVTRTRYVHRLVPVSGSCVANLPEIQALCQRIFKDFFDQHPATTFKYKIELRIRNHTTIPRPTLIQNVAQSVPEGHIVDLENPQIFILVEVFKSICGVSIVEDYYQLHKFNVMEIVSKKHRSDEPGESRVFQGIKKSEETKEETKETISDETP
ncbi:hypothetical protein BDZ97DRAFT_1015522 [Flammula alnicola]|nr:hypothetical protein BDZ97DRAFT_1015522 [Flammula alnicola]